MTEKKEESIEFKDQSFSNAESYCSEKVNDDGIFISNIDEKSNTLANLPYPSRSKIFIINSIVKFISENQKNEGFNDKSNFNPKSNKHVIDKELAIENKLSRLSTNQDLNTIQNQFIEPGINQNSHQVFKPNNLSIIFREQELEKETKFLIGPISKLKNTTSEDIFNQSGNYELIKIDNLLINSNIKGCSSQNSFMKISINGSFDRISNFHINRAFTNTKKNRTDLSVFNSCKSSNIDDNTLDKKSSYLSKFHRANKISLEQVLPMGTISSPLPNVEQGVKKSIYNEKSLFEKLNTDLYREKINKSDKKNIAKLTSLKRLQNNFVEEVSNSVLDEDFIKLMISSEREYTSEPDFLLKHENLKIEDRCFVIDFIMELCDHFAYNRDTFHNTINYFDRLLNCCSKIDYNQLQLIGIVCLTIAAKFEVK